MPAKREGIYFNPKLGRVVEHHGCSMRIHWSKDMLDYIRRHFATTINEELAGCLGVSPRTMVRKARELGLQKDPAWLAEVCEEHRRMAHMAARKAGNPSSFKKGVHYNPAGEFKPGHQLTPEEKKKQKESVRRWFRTHPAQVRAKAAKAAETRRRNRQLKLPQLPDRTNRVDGTESR